MPIRRAEPRAALGCGMLPPQSGTQNAVRADLPFADALFHGSSMIIRRAKIVCTIGPAVESREGIRGLIEAGMDVARLNFSHGSHAEHGARLDLVRSESEALGKPVAILQDLCGPKIRTGTVGPSVLETGQLVELVAGNKGTSAPSRSSTRRSLKMCAPTIGSCCPTVRSSCACWT